MTRVGLVVPSSNTTAEPAFRAILSDAHTIHAARMPLEDVTAVTARKPTGFSRGRKRVSSAKQSTDYSIADSPRSQK